MLRRRTVLALMLVGVVPAFVLINGFVSAARARRESISDDWARRGDADLATGRAVDAAEDFRTADEYAGNRGVYRLKLATALLAADRTTEAQAQLESLWTETPGDGVVNLQLARIAVRQSREGDAVRHYHAAIDGAWTTADPVASRRAARLELARFLLARGERLRAQVELVALAADPPSDVDARVDIASLLIQADADNRALTLLNETLAIHPTATRAAALAGAAAARLGDYRAARDHLVRAQRSGALDAADEALLDTVTRVLTLDPDARGLTARERLRRTVGAFEVASNALDRCSSDALAALRDRRESLAPRVTLRTLGSDPDAVDEALDFAANAIERVAATCGGETPDEHALRLVFQRRPQS